MHTSSCITVFALVIIIIVTIIIIRHEEDQNEVTNKRSPDEYRRLSFVLVPAVHRKERMVLQPKNIRRPTTAIQSIIINIIIITSIIIPSIAIHEGEKVNIDQ